LDELMQSTERKVAFVAGSSRGIGKAIARALLREGYTTVITGRDPASVQVTVQEFTAEFGAAALHFTGDLSKPTVIRDAFDKLKGACGPSLDALVVNLGSGRGRAGWDLTDEDWVAAFDVNFWAAVRISHAAIPALSSGASITFVSSIAGVERVPAPLPYCAAKAALINYAKNLSWAVAERGIRVNCIAPGNILFPGGSWEKHLQDKREQVLEYVHSEVAMKRFGTPEEIADAVVFLTSAKASFMTGECMVVDGGQSRSL
jgi:3-oxoacyl-[acyl-carrier protein] reductase